MLKAIPRAIAALEALLTRPRLQSAEVEELHVLCKERRTKKLNRWQRMAASYTRAIVAGGCFWHGNAACDSIRCA